MGQGAPRTEIAVTRDEAQIVKSAHDAIVGVDDSGTITYCNPAAGRLYGHPAEQLVGRPVEVLVPAERRAEEAEILRHVLAGGTEVPPYRTERVRSGGATIAVFATISPIADPAGRIVGAATMARRATMQDARDRFEARVAKQRSDARDAADRFEVRVNQEREEARDAAARFERRVFVERAQARDTHDGFQDQLDAADAQAHSDQDALRAQLQQGQPLEVLGQLAGGVAHDFNNLLAVILNYAAFVTEDLVEPGVDLAAAGRDVAQIQRAAERAAGLTRQLLSFARREVVRPRVVDLNDVVVDVRELLCRTVGEDIVLRTDLAADVWPVLADPRQVEQVLVNLAINSRDAMSGGGTLTIDTANVVVGPEDVPAGPPVRPGRHVRLRVSDTGVGMTAEVAAHAFEPFYTTKSDGSGAGLGLATVYGIATQAGGVVTIDSEPGLGTTLTLLVPATDEQAVPVPLPVRHDRRPAGEMVLVVDNEKALREVTERIFTRSGYKVITAAGGPEAIRAASEYDGAVHLLVTDVVMPDMLGREVAEKIREIKPEVQVLYMSGYAQPVLASQGRLDPGVNLIEKPFSADALIQQAGQVLNGHSPGHRTAERNPDLPSPG